MNSLSAERARQVLFYDTETGDLIWRARPNQSAWNAKNAGRPAGSLDRSTGYLKLSIDGRVYLAHRVAWLIAHGEHPCGIDHQDGRRSNNRLSNLRAATPSENNKNASRRSDNKSGVTGVRFCSGAWRAEIKIDRKTRYLGRFRDLEQARKARAEAMEQMGFHPNHGREAAKGATERAGR